MNRMRLIAVVALLSVVSLNAFAGLRYPYTVSVSPTSMSGGLGGTRNTSDSYVHLGVTNYPTYSRVWATDAEHERGSCTATDPDVIAVLRSVQSDGYVYVRISAGVCTSAYTQNSSIQEPKAP